MKVNHVGQFKKNKRKLALPFHYILLVLSLLGIALIGISSCKGKRSPASSSATDSDNGPSREITDWSGLTSVTDISDTTARLTWPYHEAALRYAIFNRTDSAAAWDVVENVPQGQTSRVITGLTSDTSYQLLVKAVDQYGLYDDNENYLSIHTLAAPLPPAGVTLTYPAASPGFWRTPTFTVHGVKPGDTVRIFSDNTCSSPLASGVVANDASSITLTSSTLAAGTTYHVYANSTNIQGNPSVCSSAAATYKIVDCPNEFYVPVEANDELGTDAFCVMKTEARNDGNSVPIGQYENTPWVYVTADRSKSACKSVSAASGSYDLISNREWMAVARDIEATATNWSGGAVGVGTLNRGHSDSTPSKRLSITDPTDDWSDTQDDASTWVQKRTHVLSNGAIIWDLAGNVAEWIDWEKGGAELSLGPTTCDDSEWKSPLSYECADLDPLDYQPKNPANLSVSAYMASNVGIGKVNGGIGGAAYRGLGWGNEDMVGIFALDLAFNSSDKTANLSFRCVWRPE